jgi:hypothetical protein
VAELPVTPAIRRIARAFLGFDPWQATCAAPWWAADEGDVKTLLPLDIPAGLAVAKLRAAEVAPTCREFTDAEYIVIGRAHREGEAAGVRAFLLLADPELTAPGYVSAAGEVSGG